MTQAQVDAAAKALARAPGEAWATWEDLARVALEAAAAVKPKRGKRAVEDVLWT